MSDSPASTTRPNVVFVITDDQGYGDLSCHGNPILRTPNIDRMYGESVHLADFHVGPTCAPTRAGLLTGHYANSTGVWHTIGGRSLLRKNEVSMANFFARSGYVTGMFGKWHLGDNYPYRPQDRGFHKVVTHGGGGIGNTPDYWGNKYFDDTYWTHDPAQDGYKQYEGYCTDIWFAEALSFIEENKERPFFCYIPTNAPHWPHLVPPAFSDPYLDKTPHRERAKFFGMLACIDHNFGVLRRKLHEWGLAHNTLVIFMTDNGSWGGVDVDADNFVVSGHNAGMRGRKGSEYDGGHRVPFFLHWPAGGFTEGRDVTPVTANVDILPTLIDLCGLDDPAAYDFDGTSLVPLLRDTDGKATPNWPDRALVTDSQRNVYPVKWKQSAVLTNRWRLVNGSQLYDIKADPEQRNDIAAAHPEIVARLRAAYDGWWAKVSRQYNEEIPITLGDAQSTSVLLNSHDWRNEECDCAWNQNLVRRGYKANGYWEVDVATAGRYRFELRRWPKEEDRPLTEGIPGPPPVALIDMTLETGYGGGVAIPIREAAIQIGEQGATTPVADTDKGAIFTLDLPAGPTHLQTYLYTPDGDDLGAYYVYITRVG